MLIDRKYLIKIIIKTYTINNKKGRLVVMIVNRIDELIGKTPLVKLNLGNDNADVYIKLEYF